MNIEEINKRKAEIAVEVDAEGADLDALEKELRGLNEQAEEIRSTAAKKAEVRKLAAENGTVVKTIKEEPKMDEKRTYSVDSVEYRDAYMKNLMGKSMTIEERDALASAASVIPTTTVNKIYGKLEENPLIAAIDALHIPGYVAVPKATAVNDAAWTAMGTAATDSSDTIGSVALSAYKLIKTVEITADIKAMAIPQFESWLVNKLAQKMEKAVCAAIINGDGDAKPTGIGHANITASTSVASPTVAKLAGLMSGLGSAYMSGAVWIMSAKTFYGSIMPLAVGNHANIVVEGIQPMLFGHKVVFDDNVDSCRFRTAGADESENKDHVIFGNLSAGYVYNFGEGIAIESDQSVAFRSGSTVYRAMALCDGNVVDPDAFVWADIS